MAGKKEDQGASPAPKAKSQTKSAPAAKTTKASPPFNSVVLVLVSALIGAFLALAVLYVLQTANIWPGGASAELGGIERRLAALESASGVSTGNPAEGLSEMRRAIDQLRNDVAALESLPRSNDRSGDLGIAQAVGELSNQMNSVEGRTATLEARTPDDLVDQLGGFADEAALAELTLRVATLEEAALQSDARRVATALGLAQVARAARGSQPFAETIEAVAVIRPNDALLAAIQPYAEEGVPTLAMLRADFPAIARQAARASRTQSEMTAWARVWAWLGQTVSFRRTGELEGDGANAAIARAELRLTEGDLPAAVAEMNSLPDGAQDAAADWIANAEARLALDQYVDALSTELLAELER